MKYLFLVIIFFAAFFTVKAQVPKFSEDPAVFVSEVSQMMATTRNQNAMNVANLLEMAWNSGNLSQDQKAHIIKFSKNLQAKKYRPRPHFENYYAAIGSAVNVHDFKGAQINQLLDVIDKTYEKEDIKTVENFMATTARFLATKALYRTTTNSLRIVGGTFNFEYRYGNEVDEPEPAKVAPKPVPKPAPPKPVAKAPAKKTASKKPAPKKSSGWDDWSGWEEETGTTDKKDDDAWGTIPDNEVKTPSGQALGVDRYLTEEMPILKGPVIVIKDADISLASQYDSVTIQKTSGVVSLLRNVFVGKGGKFDWTVNGNEASAELKKYTFNITRSEFKAEGASITYPAVLEAPIEGIFEYKAKKRNTTADTGFPRFASFTNDAKIKNLGPDLGYRGGFSLAGAKIMSAALDGSFSYLSAKIGEVKKFKASSRSFSLGDTVITSDRAGITIYQEKDSITHPGMGFKFSRGRNLLKMVENNNSAFKHSPFVDSYHKMEITADMLAWQLEQKEINFSIVGAKEQVSAQIESFDYFSNTRYQQLKGISSFHPLQMAVGYGQLKKTDRFYAVDLARDNKIKEIAVKRAMASLARDGYIDYNSTTGFIILKPKAIHYVNAHRDKKDFDHISIKSRSPAGKNATLDLESKILMLRGVRQFAFNADSGAIVVRPDSGIVRVKQNRDMDFNGRVVTPNFIFKGSEFKFSYNNYWIDMVKIDSLIFRTSKKGKKGKEKVDVAGMDPAKAEAAQKAAEAKARATADSLAMVSAPEDFPEDDSVKIRKAQELKMQKKLAKQKAKEEKKKAKALAKAKKAKKKKPQLDEYGDPIIEEEETALADASEVAKPVVKKPKPTGPTEKALTGLNGKLYLNKPNNKSGRKKIPGYPMFDASTGAVVYFNKPDVLGGAYDSSVYFTIPPFKLDSISSTSQSAVNFKGTFHSGNIFPPIETRLTVMPDQSLGFDYVMPKEGLALYGGKGKATGNIILNENGLQTKGTISYLTTTLKADTFTYYLDSVSTTRGISGAIAASNIFPDAKIDHFSMNWHVSEDRLALNKPDTLFNKETMDPIKFYKDQFAYSGQAIVTPNGVLGNGTVESDETRIKSPLFNFQQGHFKGNNANMEIKSSNPDKPALLASDVQLDYNLQKGSADFAPEKAGFASTELPYSQFKTSLSGGNWDFKKKIVTMKEPANREDLTGSYFYSTNPEQDTLRFNAANAFYDLSNYTLIAGGVPHIASNDAYIYPSEGKVEIGENAKIKMLSNSRIEMDSLSKYHELVNGEIEVMSRKEFQGTATLMYKNSQGKAFPIPFSAFTRDSVKVAKGEPKEYFTKATGSVYEENKMELLPKILYKGDVYMSSNKQLLDFEGEMKLNFGSESSSDWFPYKNTVNPDSIRITIKDMKTAEGEPLITGLHVSSSNSQIYSTFVSQKGDPTDLDLFQVDGLLSYDKDNKEFILGDAGRAYGESYQGNMMTYNDVSSVSKYSGSFNLIKSDKDFKLKASGETRARLDSGRFSMDSFLAFDINLPAAAWVQMGSMIADNAGGAPEAVVNSTPLFYKLGEFIGNKAVQDYANQTSSNYVPFPKVSAKLIHSLVFSEVHLKWSKKNSAWYSVGSLGLANIDKKDINSQMGGHIEIRRIGETDNVTIYVEVNPTTWYYFNYYENALTVASSDHKFNQILAPRLKPAGTIATTFTPIAGETIDRNVFVKSFRGSYLGGKGAPLVDVPAPIIDDAPAEEEDAGTAKKKKKKKGTATEDEFSDTPAEEPAGDVPTEEAPAKKKKKEKVKKETEGDMPVDEPVQEAPVEEKPKKKKEKVKVEEEPPLDEAPAEEAPVKKKKEKKKKSDEEDTDMDMAP